MDKISRSKVFIRASAGLRVLDVRRCRRMLTGMNQRDTPISLAAGKLNCCLTALQTFRGSMTLVLSRAPADNDNATASPDRYIHVVIDSGVGSLRRRHIG